MWHTPSSMFLFPLVPHPLAPVLDLPGPAGFQMSGGTSRKTPAFPPALLGIPLSHHTVWCLCNNICQQTLLSTSTMGK